MTSDLKTSPWKRGIAAYANLPVRAKLLVPFAVLMLIWGGFGTFVLAKGAAGEARGRATARLAEALDGARASFSDIERSLLETERLAAFTEGMSDAIQGHDRTSLERLLLPIALNAGHSRIEATDRSGRVLTSIEVSGKRSRVRSGGTRRERAVRKAAGGRSDKRGDKFIALTADAILIAGPVRDESGRAVGAVVVSESISHVAERMARGIPGRVAIFSTARRLVVSNESAALPHRSTTDGLRASVATDAGRFEAIYAPLEARGERLGTIAVGLPAKIALAGVKGTATILAILVGFAVLAAVGIGILTARAITRPLGSLLDATKSLERGDLGARAAVEAKDEVGILATQFNRMAEELQASHEELERKVAERTGELARVNTELERASNAKSAFLATMSHELRTPLNAIIGFADMLSDPTFGRMSDRDTRELSSNILASGRHLLTLINDVLDLAKVEAGKIDIHPQTLELAGVVAEVESIMTPLARDKRTKLVVEPLRGVPKIVADPARLRQVLYNLLSNAIKFTPANGRVTLGVERDGEAVVVSVADNGPGLTRAEAEKIFEPYERGRASRNAEGAGLGLALARHLVELQSGRIWVTSRPGKGSTFCFTVPVAGARAARGVEQAQILETAAPRRKAVS